MHDVLEPVQDPAWILCHEGYNVQTRAPILAKYGGRLVKLTGDGALVEFGSAVDALSAADGLRREVLRPAVGLLGSSAGSSV
jgi:class 3 adenylate cyclase